MICPNCRAEIAADRKHCTQCGERLPAVCVRCGGSNPRDARFCGDCGAPLDLDHVAERRQISVLFCDVVSSSAISQQLDAEDLRNLLREYQARCGEVLRRLDGYVAQYLGDGVLAYFGYPVAHEDDAVRAVLAGLRMIGAAAQPSKSVPDLGDTSLRVRVAIHTGSVVVGEMGAPERREFLAVGETPNLAARLQVVAEPNSVVVSEATHRLTHDQFQYRELGTEVLKGFSTPVKVYQALSLARSSRRFARAVPGLGPMVDRSVERAFLRERWRETVAGGRVVAAISGEAGIGKSRLVRALADEIRDEPHLFLECCCSPLFSSTALYPFTELIERELGFAQEPSAAIRLQKLERALARLNLDLKRHVPPLASHLSLPLPERYGPPEVVPPQKARQALFESLLAWVRAVATEQPLLFVMEDVHWADNSSLELLGMMIALEQPRSMLLCSHRSDASLPWGPERIARLPLARLPPGDAEQLATGVIRAHMLRPEVVREVLARADGVPLYIEEITKAVLETSDAHVTVSKPRSARSLSQIPTSLQDSLNARLDRLGAGKPILQLAAVIGRRFRFDLLQSLSDLNASVLHAQLDRLVAAELVLRDNTPEEAYVFKHALIQDAAYESLLRSARQAHHERIAATLIATFPELAGAQPELLARHYEGAGMAQEAAQQWGLAGARALSRSANMESAHAYGKASEQLALTPASEARTRQMIDFQMYLGVALTSFKGYAAPAVEETYRRAHALCDELSDVPVNILVGLMSVFVVRAELEATERLTHLLKPYAAGSGEEAQKALLVLGIRAFFAGDYQAAADALQRSTDLLCFDSVEDVRAGLQAGKIVDEYFNPPLYLAWCRAVLGFPSEARVLWQRVLRLAEQLDHPFAMAMCLSFSAQILCYTHSDAALALKLGQRMLALAQVNNFPFWIATGSVHVGLHEVRTGVASGPGTGIERIQLGLQMIEGMGAFVLSCHAHSALCEAYTLCGKLDEALAVADKGLAFCAGKLTAAQRPQLQKCKADALLASGDTAAARALYAEALASFREQGARVFELHTACALVRASRDDVELHAAACRRLREVYEIPLDDPELPIAAEARALLDPA